MATYGSINVSLRDYKGKTASVKVIVPEDKATLANGLLVAAFLEDYSCAAVTGYGVSVDYTDTTITGKYDRVLQALKLLYKNADGKQVRFSIPAPKDGNVNDDQEPDSDVAEDVKDLLVSIGASSAFVYEGGGLKSRLPSKEARSTQLTGV